MTWFKKEPQVIVHQVQDLEAQAAIARLEKEIANNTILMCAVLGLVVILSEALWRHLRK